jgi:TonB family protein
MRFGFLICAVLLLSHKPAAGPDQEATVYDVGDGVSRPINIKSPRPRYSAEAMKAKLDGLIRVEAIVRPDGSVSDVKLVKGVDSKYWMNEEAVDAARQWVFKPGMKDGKPVAVRVIIDFAFAYQSKKPKSNSK